MACVDPKQLVLLDVGYIVDNVDPPWKGVSCDPSCGSNDDLDDAKEGFICRYKLSHRDLIFFFRQLRVKCRCDRKPWERITFNK